MWLSRESKPQIDLTEIITVLLFQPQISKETPNDRPPPDGVYSASRKLSVPAGSWRWLLGKQDSIAEFEFESVREHRIWARDTRHQICTYVIGSPLCTFHSSYRMDVCFFSVANTTPFAALIPPEETDSLGCHSNQSTFSLVKLSRRSECSQ